MVQPPIIDMVSGVEADDSCHESPSAKRTAAEPCHLWIWSRWVGMSGSGRIETPGVAEGLVGLNGIAEGGGGYLGEGKKAT